MFASLIKFSDGLPPILICINPLVLFVRQSWNGNNALLVMKASSLLPSSPRVFCPLLSCSLSSVSLRDFFGVAHLITVAGQATSSYRNVLLLFFLVMAKLERAQFLRMAYRKRCYTLYFLFLLFSLLSRLHRNNANNPDTLFFRMNHFPLFYAIVF